MKLLLLFAFCIFSLCAFAQTPKETNPYSFQLADTFKIFKGNENTLQLREYWQRKQTPQTKLTSKLGKVVILPQDNMPCIVPETNVAAKIPNAWGSVTKPYIAPVNPIPNPSLPKSQSFKYNAFDNSLGIPSK